jgi:hypothetical protein
MTSYLVTAECPSSMVGTIAAFEAVLLHTARPWTKEEEAFVDAGARFLMARRLMSLLICVNSFLMDRSATSACPKGRNNPAITVPLWR